MATETQIDADRENVKKSTGTGDASPCLSRQEPVARNASGQAKGIASQNSRRHHHLAQSCPSRPAETARHSSPSAPAPPQSRHEPNFASPNLMKNKVRTPAETLEKSALPGFAKAPHSVRFRFAQPLHGYPKGRRRKPEANRPLAPKSDPNPAQTTRFRPAQPHSHPPPPRPALIP